MSTHSIRLLATFLLLAAPLSSFAQVGRLNRFGTRPFNCAPPRTAGIGPRSPLGYSNRFRYPNDLLGHQLYGGYPWGPQPYGTYYQPGSGYLEYYSPAIYAPAELGYGPQALLRFLGINNGVATPTPANPALGASPLDLDAIGGRAALGDAGALGDTAAARPLDRTSDRAPLVRRSNPATLQRARKFIRNGDQLFRESRPHEAIGQYRSAVKIAPDLAEAFFRQSFAYVATSRYEHAARALRRGLDLDPDFPASEFRLDEIYGDAALAKSTVLEGLAATALEHTGDADMMWLVGVFFHFDGDRDRAVKFFRRAHELTLGDRSYVEAFWRPA